MVLVRGVVLAGAFAAAAWAGYALSADPIRASGDGAPGTGEGRPGVSAETRAPSPAAAKAASAPVPGAPLGDLDAAPAPGPKAADDGKPVRLSFSDISSWDLDPRDIQVPASVLALHGRTVDLVGYMIPYGNPDAVEEFVLVRDLGSCCFGQAPLPHHVIECRFEEGKRVAYVPGPVRVRGRFRVEEHRMGQYLVSVFAMTVTDCVEVR